MKTPHQAPKNELTNTKIVITLTDTQGFTVDEITNLATLIERTIEPHMDPGHCRIATVEAIGIKAPSLPPKILLRQIKHLTALNIRAVHPAFKSVTTRLNELRDERFDFKIEDECTQALAAEVLTLVAGTCAKPSRWFWRLINLGAFQPRFQTMWPLLQSAARGGQEKVVRCLLSRSSGFAFPKSEIAASLSLAHKRIQDTNRMNIIRLLKRAAAEAS